MIEYHPHRLHPAPVHTLSRISHGVAEAFHPVGFVFDSFVGVSEDPVFHRSFFEELRSVEGEKPRRLHIPVSGAGMLPLDGGVDVGDHHVHPVVDAPELLLLPFGMATPVHPLQIPAVGHRAAPETGDELLGLLRASFSGEMPLDIPAVVPPVAAAEAHPVDLQYVPVEAAHPLLVVDHLSHPFRPAQGTVAIVPCRFGIDQIVVVVAQDAEDVPVAEYLPDLPQHLKALPVVMAEIPGDDQHVSPLPEGVPVEGEDLLFIRRAVEIEVSMKIAEYVYRHI